MSEVVFSSSRFDEALEVTLTFEGGFVDDPDDRGGATNKGITQAVYDSWRVKQGFSKISVREITDEEVQAIYYKDYWLIGHCASLPWPASMAHFDGCVNHGVRNAAKLLQKAVGASPDGKIGPKTLTLMEATPMYQLTERLLQEREKFYIKIVDARPSQIKFLKGWIRRVLILRDKTYG